MDIEAFPVARGMIRLAYDSNLAVFIRYMCLWSAFNNIYQHLANVDKIGSKLQLENPYPKPREIDGYYLPNVSTKRELDLILNTTGKLSTDQKSDLLLLPQLGFFVYRTPHGAEGDRYPNTLGLFDKKDQRINGVLNRTRTVDPLYPYYAPIDLEKYESFRDGDPTHIDLLSDQLAMLLYTVRNNLMHGHKAITSDNDGEVVRKAYPILEHLLSFFVNIRHIQERRRAFHRPS